MTRDIALEAITPTSSAQEALAAIMDAGSLADADGNARIPAGKVTGILGACLLIDSSDLAERAQLEADVGTFSPLHLLRYNGEIADRGIVENGQVMVPIGAIVPVAASLLITAADADAVSALATND